MVLQDVKISMYAVDTHEFIAQFDAPAASMNLERVHIKRASKIIANIITERKIESSLS